jgi:hypothetical protein
MGGAARLTSVPTAGRSRDEVTLPRPYVVALLILAVGFAALSKWVAGTPRPVCWQQHVSHRNRSDPQG